MTMVNLTPHEVAVFDGERVVVRVAPSGIFARLAEHVRLGDGLETGTVRIPTVTVMYEARVLGLPEPSPGTIFVVSRVLAAEVRRPDIYFPHDEVRDEAGRIIGFRALGQFDSRDA